MMGRVLLSLAFLAAVAPVAADMPAVCRVAEPQIERDFPLPQVMRAKSAIGTNEQLAELEKRVGEELDALAKEFGKPDKFPAGGSK